MQEGNTDPTQEPKKDVSKKEKLYKVLKGKALYTKSFEEFSQQFGEEKSQEKLYKVLSEKSLYTKDLESFKSQFFSQAKKEEAPKKATAVSTESPSDSAQKAGESVSVWSPNDYTKQNQEVEEDPILKQIEARKQEPNPEIVELYEAYKKNGEITVEDRQQVAKKIADQKKGEGRGWYETAGAYIDGWLRSGMPVPLYKYDTEEDLLEKRELARKSTFLESLPNEKREELNAYAVNRTLALDKASQNILAENSILEEKSKLLVKNVGNIADAIKRQQESGKAVPQEMWEEYKKRKDEVEDISVKYNNNVDVIESNNEDIGSFVEELDLLKKNYTGIGYYKDLARLTTADMLSGIMEFGVSTAEMIPTNVGLGGSQQSFPEAEKFIADFRAETQSQRSLIKPQLSIEDVEVGKNFGKWLAEQTMVQLPVLTTLAASGGSVGLGILGTSSAGSKMGELKDYQTDLRTKIENKKLEIAKMDGDDFIDPEVKANALKQLSVLENKPTYGKAEIYLAGAGNGLAEVLSEKVSLGILSKGKRALKAANKTELKMGYKEYFTEVAETVVGGGIGFGKESTAEFGNTLVQNAIDILYLGDEDVHIFDGTLDAWASGGAMGAGMSMFPSLVGMGSKAFMGKSASDLMTKNSAKLTTLLDELEMGRETLPESTKKIMLDKVNSIIKEQDATLKEAFKRAKERSTEDNAKLIEIDKEANKIMKAVQDIKAGGLTPTMQADLLNDLKEKRDKLIEKKLEILEKKPIKKKSDGEAKLEDATETEQSAAEGEATETVTKTETDTTEKDSTTEDGTGATIDEGTEGGNKVQGKDGEKPSLDGDGKGVQLDSDGTKGATSEGDVAGVDNSVEGKKYVHPVTGNEAKNQAELDKMRDFTKERIKELEAQKAQKINWDKGKAGLLRGNKGVLKQIEAFSFEGADTQADTTAENRVDEISVDDIPNIDLSDKLGLNKLTSFLDKADKAITESTKDTLGINLPVAVAQGAIKAMKLAVATAKTGADVISAGINYMRSTDWYKGLGNKEKAEAEKDFLNNLNQPRDKTKPSRRETMETEIGDMVAKGASESTIIDSYDTKKEKEIATDILSRKKTLTKEEAKAKLDATFDKAQKEMYEKKHDIKSWNRYMRKLALWIFDRQYVPKMVLKKSGLNLIRNYMITSKGASGYAKFMYDEAYKKIYQKTINAGKELVVNALSSAEIKELDKIIMVRRIIAIDKNRAERGMPPVTQTGFLNGAESELALEQMKEDMGEEKFNDMNKRADAYFEAFQELLSAMEESGLVSKEFADKFFNVDYQPKVYLDFLKTAEQEMSIIEMGAEESASLASEQVRSLEEGSAGSLITDSRYLLSRSMNARAKAVAMNMTVSRLSTEMEAQAEVVKKLKDKNPKDLTAKERKTIKYFDELSKAVKHNPIAGFTKSGKPKYKYKAGRGSHPQYYYKNGVRHMLIMEESFFDAFNDNVRGIWKNSNVKEKVAIGSLSGLVKTIATGNNPAFFLTNAPRDFMFVATFSPVYGSVVPWNLVKVFGGMVKGIVDIESKNDSFRNFVKYGGMLDFLHKQGEFKGTSWTRRKLSTKEGKLLGVFGNKSKNFAGILWNSISFKKLQMWSEIGVRMAVFNQSVKNQFKAEGVKNEAELLDKLGEEGATKLQDIYVNATAEARNTTDFSQGGIYVKDADAIIPYLNAGVQGTRVAIEQLGANGASGFVQTSLRMVQSAALLSAIPMAIGIKMLGWLSDDEVPEEYKGLSAGERYLKARGGVSRYDQTNYSIWFTGKFDADGEAQYIRVAKPHFLTPFIAYAEGLQLNIIKKGVGDITPDDTMERVKWAVESNISPIELSVTGTIARNPILKSSLTYTTGYDFYRDQDLSYLRGDVKVATEGHESNSVEAFYKTIGLEHSVSPARMKGAVESIITTPSTSPFIGILYGGLDAILADEEAKQAMGNDEARVFKSLTGRLIKTTSEYNRRINFDKDFDKEVSKLEIYDIKNKAKFKDLTKKLMKEEIDSSVLGEELVKLAKESPFDAKRMANIIKSTAENPNVPPMVYQIKFATAKERALYLAHIYGGDFLEVDKEMSKDNKKLWQALFTNKAINKETIVEYRKLIGK